MGKQATRMRTLGNMGNQHKIRMGRDVELPQERCDEDVER